ncbi:hypothetical protein BGZ60DRAFT_407451 [Tricladium varicosporioides]|nr:hypothetical protein BGZ60DRAFT_407451 [Hymenoscyphus varicosporioides]
MDDDRHGTLPVIFTMCVLASPVHFGRAAGVSTSSPCTVFLLSCRTADETALVQQSLSTRTMLLSLGNQDTPPPRAWPRNPAPRAAAQPLEVGDICEDGDEHRTLWKLFRRSSWVKNMPASTSHLGHRPDQTRSINW